MAGVHSNGVWGVCRLGWGGMLCLVGRGVHSPAVRKGEGGGGGFKGRYNIVN